MRIKASDGKLYDPEKSRVLDKRELPDGKIETLLRSVNGSYFIYTTPEEKIKGKSITPMSYDSAIEWIDKYSSRSKIYGIMIFDADDIVNMRFTVESNIASTASNIAAIINKSRTEVIENAIKEYAKHLEDDKNGESV